ncbi:MAG: phospholipid carrier-dependent glycosyltransferase [Clostridia bacterium]|nr:phospholipid carrier-dependent glycosyltransferase [Clostridia bacterium]
MNKSNRTFLITAIILVVFYVASAIITLGTVFTPSTAWQIKTQNPDRNNTYQNAFVNVDIKTTKPNPEKEGDTVTANIAKIYVFVGNVYSFATDESGNEYVDIVFHFKTKSDNTNTSYLQSFTYSLPVVYGTGGYKWIKVYDSKDIDEKTGKEKGEISLNRVKINTPDKFDFHEVVFTDSTGYVLDTQINAGTDEQKQMARLLVDEREFFTESNSKKYVLTDAELKNLASVEALKGGRAVVSNGPLSTVFNLISTSIFGANTFAMRFFDCLAGLGLLLMAFMFVSRLFDNPRYSVLSLVFCLAMGGVFTASNFAFAGVGAFFAVLSLYFTMRFFIKHYYLEDVADAVLCLLGSGVSLGLAISCNMAYALISLGHLAMLIMAFRRSYKRYKEDDKKAVGLEKEDLFLAYRKKKIILVFSALGALVVLPTILFTISYWAIASVYQAFYGVGFLQSAVKHLVACFTPNYQSFPLALLVGFGGVTENGYHSFLTYLPTILALLSLIFVTVTLYFRKKVDFFKNVGVISNKYKMVTTAFVSTLLPVLFGLTSSPSGFAGASVFYAVYIVFAESILVKCFNSKKVKLIMNILAGVSLAVFCLAYLGYVGVQLPEIVSKILYLWQVI